MCTGTPAVETEPVETFITREGAVQRWPAYQSHYTGQRSILVLECAPDEDSPDCREHSQRAAGDEPDGPTYSLESE